MSSTPSTTTKTSGFVGHARTVSVLTFLSRLTGLMRDSYLGAAFGIGPISDAFWTGFLIPNLFRRLFGEGALTAAFIPAYTDLLAKDKQLARRLASLCLGLTALILGLLLLLGELALAGLLWWQADWPADLLLAVKLTMVMLPYMPLVCLVALIGAMLQVHGRFAPAAGMPVFLNLAMIAATAFGLWWSSGEHQAIGAMYWVSASVAAAGLIQVVTQAWMLRRYEAWTMVYAGVGPALRGMLKTFLPMLIALSVFQINTAMDTMIALFLSPKADAAAGGGQLSLLGWMVDYPVSSGGVTAMNNANRLYQFPLGVFGLAIASAIFPALAHAAARQGDQAREDFRATLQQGLKLTVFIGLPASVGLMLIGLPLSRAIYEHGKIDLQGSQMICQVLMAYAPAIWAYSLTHVITRAFYAQKDPRTPLRISLWMVGLNLILNLILVWPMGAAGLACSSAICAMVQVYFMLRALQRYVDRPVDSQVWKAWRRTAMLTGLMTLLLLPILQMIPPSSLSQGQSCVQLAALVLVGGAVFLLGAYWMKAPELGWLLKRRRDAGMP